REQLTRLGGLSETDAGRFEVEALSPNLLDWRTRVRYAVDSRGKPGLRRHRSHEIIHIDKCVIATPAIREHDALARRWPGGGEVALVDDDSEELSVLTHQGRRTKLAEGDGEIVQSAVGRR